MDFPRNMRFDDQDDCEEKAARIATQMFRNIVGSAGGELTMRQMAILMEITTQPLGMGEISEKLGISKPSVSRSCDALEKNGLVDRRRGDEDTRRITVEPTPKGLAMVGKTIMALAGHIG